MYDCAHKMPLMDGFLSMDRTLSDPYRCDMAALVQLEVGASRALDVVWVVVALRALWLLPDWLAKWQHVLGRRASRRR
jgi:hypothetical protein